jgi:hypothetical protein
MDKDKLHPENLYFLLKEISTNKNTHVLKSTPYKKLIANLNNFYKLIFTSSEKVVILCKLSLQ